MSRASPPPAQSPRRRAPGVRPTVPRAGPPRAGPALRRPGRAESVAQVDLAHPGAALRHAVAGRLPAAAAPAAPADHGRLGPIAARAWRMAGPRRLRRSLLMLQPAVDR